jgi:hypothetical protein
MPSAREKALKAFQRLRRYQCADSSGIVRCISCGVAVKVRSCDGGHYEGRTNRATELESDNVWGQCKRCNGPLGGNTIAYRNRLIARIGIDRVERVERLALAYRGDQDALSLLSEKDRQWVLHKRTNKEYEELAKAYNILADQLSKERCDD